MKPVEATWKGRGVRRGGGTLILEPPAHNPGNVCLFFVFTARCKASRPPGPPLHPRLEPLEYTAESRDRTGSQHDIQCSEPAAVARGQKCGAKLLRTAGYCIASRNLQS